MHCIAGSIMFSTAVSLDLRSVVKTGVYFTAAICPHSDSKPRADIDTENRRDNHDVPVLQRREDPHPSISLLILNC